VGSVQISNERGEGPIGLKSLNRVVLAARKVKHGCTAVEGKRKMSLQGGGGRFEDAKEGPRGFGSGERSSIEFEKKKERKGKIERYRKRKERGD